MDVGFSCVCPVIENEFRRSIHSYFDNVMRKFMIIPGQTHRLRHSSIDELVSSRCKLRKIDYSKFRLSEYNLLYFTYYYSRLSPFYC